MFRTPEPLDFVALAASAASFWELERIFPRLVAQNRGGPRFSFLDGPITANNPMGIHHAWGRTYKDVVQRYKALRGHEQRFQNGFDCQGLWVEVEVEKTLGFNSKREIESFGLERFSSACRERVLHFAALQTEQSRRLGQWMDWPSSYYTMSDTNIEYNWGFLRHCHDRGWLYRGHRPMPWCARCGTSISQHEMLDAYADLTHQALTVALPLAERPDHRLLVWTTTPWTLPANVAAAVHPDLDYAECEGASGVHYIAANLLGRYPALGRARRTVKGAALVGLRYRAPFDDLPAQRGVEHRVVAWEDVSAEEGTGIVHLAPGCGLADFDVGRRHDLPVIAAADEEGRYLEGFGALSGTPVLEAAPAVAARLKERGLLFARAGHRHRYPTCWRCGQELIFRVADEWFLSAAEIRPAARAASAAVTWLPDHMQRRMDDWLANMGDWCISRKRYWGLPLPFYPCRCGRLTVVGSRAAFRGLALDAAAMDAVPELHRPWVDAVLIGCPDCGKPVARVPEVGDCWLDAGIVPFSTLGYREDRAEWARWFPADFVVEAVGQLRGWFYALLFMATALEGRSPYRTVLAHERVLAADGREMHKSWGNAIWLDDALAQMGPDVVRHVFASQPITDPLRFGLQAGREVKRRLLTLWNVYGLFVTHANLDRPALQPFDRAPAAAGPLERWLLSRLQAAIAEAGAAFDAYQLRRAVGVVDAFIHEDLSNWYVRRRRRALWKGTLDEDKQAAFRTLYHVLVRVCQLLAPVMPFMTEQVYRNLVPAVSPEAPPSIHLTRFPEPDPALVEPDLEAQVAAARRVLNVGLAARNAARIKVRQPLGRALLVGPPEVLAAARRFEADILDELNVERLESVPDLPGRPGLALATDRDVTVGLDTEITPALRSRALARHLVHQIQMLRKEARLNVEDRIHLSLEAQGEVDEAIEEHRGYICAETLTVELRRGAPPAGWTAREALLDEARVVVAINRA